VRLAVACPLHESIPRSSVLGVAAIESGVGIVVFRHNFFVTIAALFSNQWPVY
jgi:hypothetical protein